MVIFLSLEIESQWHGPEIMSRRRIGSRKKISEEDGEGV